MSPWLIRRVEARSSVYRLLCCTLALGALLAGASACGGRWRTVTTTPDDDSSASGGSAGVSGASSSHAGHASTGQAGSSSAGNGSSACSDVACPDTVCPSGTKPVFLTGECCQTCESVCDQGCPACGPGTLPQMTGGCCPECLPTQSCEAGQMSYQDVRTSVTYKYSYGCSSDSDCAVVAPANLCESGCNAAAIPKSLVDSYTEYLKSEAMQDCPGCKQGPVPPCAAPPAAHCYAGQCAFMP